jgi:phage terminase small subunit
MKAETVNRKAKELLDNGKIKARLAELRGIAQERSMVTVDGITANLLRIAEKAEALAEAPGLSVARASMMDVAKLNGLVVDKAQTDTKTEVSIITRRVVDPNA